MGRPRMRALDDTIAAIATAPGAAGLAVVRVSGPAALAVADAVFRGARALSAAAGNTLHHGWAVWPGEATYAPTDAARARVRVERAPGHGARAAGAKRDALLEAGAADRER